MEEPKNTGVNIELEEAEVTNDDWVFGGQYDDELILNFDPEEYLPQGEAQNYGQDKMDCVWRAYANKIETVFNYLYRNNRLSPGNKRWIEDVGFIVWENGMSYFVISNKFNSIKSGTSRQGNSLKRPADSAHRDGIIPRAMLAEDKPETWDEYHNPKQITQEMVDIGKEFKKRFPLNYERVAQAKWKTLPIGCACVVHAWPRPVNGIYPQAPGSFNHCVYELKPEWKIFDNYPAWVENNWVKQLASNFNFYPYGYRLIFHENPLYDAPADGETYNTEFKKGDGLTFLQMWYAIFKKRIGALGKKLGSIINK